MTPNTLSLRSIVDVILFIGPDERALNLISTLQFAKKILVSNEDKKQAWAKLNAMKRFLRLTFKCA